jgi:hypothetical protein
VNVMNGERGQRLRLELAHVLDRTGLAIDEVEAARARGGVGVDDRALTRDDRRVPRRRAPPPADLAAEDPIGAGAQPSWAWTLDGLRGKEPSQVVGAEAKEDRARHLAVPGQFGIDRDRFLGEHDRPQDVRFVPAKDERRLLPRDAQLLPEPQLEGRELPDIGGIARRREPALAPLHRRGIELREVLAAEHGRDEQSGENPCASDVGNRIASHRWNAASARARLRSPLRMQVVYDPCQLRSFARSGQSQRLICSLALGQDSGGPPLPRRSGGPL